MERIYDASFRAYIHPSQPPHKTALYTNYWYHPSHYHLQFNFITQVFK